MTQALVLAEVSLLVSIFNVGKRCDKSGNGSAKSLQPTRFNDVRLTSCPSSNGNVVKLSQELRFNDVSLTNVATQFGNVSPV